MPNCGRFARRRELACSTACPSYRARATPACRSEEVSSFATWRPVPTGCSWERTGSRRVPSRGRWGSRLTGRKRSERAPRSTTFRLRASRLGTGQSRWSSPCRLPATGCDGWPIPAGARPLSRAASTWSRPGSRRAPTAACRAIRWAPWRIVIAASHLGIDPTCPAQFRIGYSDGHGRALPGL